MINYTEQLRNRWVKEGFSSQSIGIIISIMPNKPKNEESYEYYYRNYTPFLIARRKREKYPILYKFLDTLKDNFHLRTSIKDFWYFRIHRLPVSMFTKNKFTFIVTYKGQIISHRITRFIQNI